MVKRWTLEKIDMIPGEQSPMIRFLRTNENSQRLLHYYLSVAKGAYNYVAVSEFVAWQAEFRPLIEAIQYLRCLNAL
jgi:hypothetical protein